VILREACVVVEVDRNLLPDGNGGSDAQQQCANSNIGFHVRHPFHFLDICSLTSRLKLFCNSQNPVAGFSFRLALEVERDAQRENQGGDPSPRARCWVLQ
jgi:hypothetical protein